MTHDDHTHEPDLPPENDLQRLAMQIRYEASDAQSSLTRAQGKISELLRQIGMHDLADKPTTNFNGPHTYAPGTLRYLKQAAAVWDSAPDDEREQQARVLLAGFTGNEEEIQEHLAALRVRPVLRPVEKKGDS